MRTFHSEDWASSWAPLSQFAEEFVFPRKMVNPEIEAPKWEAFARALAAHMAKTSEPCRAFVTAQKAGLLDAYLDQDRTEKETLACPDGTKLDPANTGSGVHGLHPGNDGVRPGNDGVRPCLDLHDEL